MSYPLLIIVEGKAAPYSTTNETEWRKKIQAATEQYLQDNPNIKKEVDRINANISFFQFSVEITFVVSNPDGADIDNLSKPVIDTLFSALPNKDPGQEKRKPTGVLFSKVPDTRVYHLSAQKRSPHFNEKTQIIIGISWT